MVDTLLDLQNITKDYKLKENTIQALTGVTLSVLPHEFLIMTGPTGSGRTTLSNIVATIDVPDGGSAIFDGANLKLASHDSLQNIRRKMGIVPFLPHGGRLAQLKKTCSPFLPTNEKLSVFDFLSELTEGVKLSKEVKNRYVDEALQRCWHKDQGFDTASIYSQRVDKLDLDTKLRVYFARALVTKPYLLLIETLQYFHSPFFLKTLEDLLSVITGTSRDSYRPAVVALPDPDSYPLYTRFASREIKFEKGHIAGTIDWVAGRQRGETGQVPRSPPARENAPRANVSLNRPFVPSNPVIPATPATSPKPSKPFYPDLHLPPVTPTPPTGGVKNAGEAPTSTTNDGEDNRRIVERGKDSLARRAWAEARHLFQESEAICTRHGWDDGVRYAQDQQDRASEGEEAARKDRLKQLVQVSEKLRVGQIAQILDLTEAEVYRRLVDWATEFGFTIDEDLVKFGEGRKEDFLAQLDKEFQAWEQNLAKKG